MLKSVRRSLVLCAAALLTLTVSHTASAVVTVFDPADETTLPNPNGGGTNAKGVWFNVLTGVIDNRSTNIFPTPLFEDGKYFLVWNTGFTQAAGEARAEGLFSRGNDILTDGTANIIKYGGGASVSLATGTSNESSGFVDLGPTFGHFALGERGYIGLVIGNGSNTTAQARYGWADISLNLDGSVTLYRFAYESALNTPIVTPAIVPEPTSLSLIALGGTALLGRRRRTA